MDRTDRLDRAGRLAAYGAALVMTPYALIKVTWVVGAIVGLLPIGDGFSLPGWVVLNTTTVGMAGIGIAMALALVRPWGMRLPGPLVAFVAWVGSGFLVAMLPYAVLDALLGGSDGGPRQAGHDPVMPGWEAGLIQLSFVGMGPGPLLRILSDQRAALGARLGVPADRPRTGSYLDGPPVRPGGMPGVARPARSVREALGLAIALPAYLRRRWPEAFAGRVGDGGTGRPRRVSWALGAAAVVGLVWLSWAAGGAAGVAHPADRVTGWRLLNGVCGLWALTASAATWAISRGRPARLPRWVPLAFGWLGTGSLFAWSGWKLPLTLYVALAHPAGAALPENLAVAAVLHTVAVPAAAVMLPALVRDRGASHHSFPAVQCPTQPANPGAPVVNPDPAAKAARSSTRSSG
ncbi:hypothetical protein [Kitasatospora sp. LaBMicrA B282]|uniref:hypothetical protein n=1 Tax=Kitasatospora sp. LaBMicrA B282 TaxID=3420949 RepID=UPI003D0DEA54